MPPLATIETPERSERDHHPTHRSATDLAITGMTCGNCARHVTEALQSVPGVHSAQVSLDDRQASVRWAEGAKPNTDAVIHAVEEAGYGAKVIVDACCHHDHATHKLAGWELNLWIGVLCTAPLMLGEWVFNWALTPWFAWVSFALASIVQVFAGAGFYKGAWNQLKRGSSNMDTLVALGSTTAFVYSAWALLSGYHGHLYFMEAASIITIVSIGHAIEARVSVKASSALRQLLDLTPRTARRLNPDGTETEVPVEEIKPGDLIALRPGDRVPTDGKVVEGVGAVEESMLTGESKPVDKNSGSEVYAGTVNLNGKLIMQVTLTGEATALAHIIAVVQRAQTSRASIQRLGDQVSSVFVPIVVTFALAAGLWWGLAPESARRVHDSLTHFLWLTHPPEGGLASAFIVAAAVLIVACPCAMGLATPAAIMAASNAAARRGILVRDGVALEKAGTITAVMFDKTGTLTLGKPSVAKIWETSASRVRPQELAAALARNSNHPVSREIAKLSSEKVDFAEWEEVRGSGVQGNANHRLFRLGSLRWLSEFGVDLKDGEAFVQEWSAKGATLVGLAEEKALLAIFAVIDTVKPGAREVIQQLESQGLKTYMVTGDNSLTGKSIARQAGITSENVFAEIRPEQKADLVRKLQNEGERVAFVGDGINDAPALEQADLGIAVSKASDIAREAADIVLLRSEIEAVPESLRLARATLRTIKQNLFWAFFYNALGVPLAGFGFMSPIICAVAMGFSDIVVIGNALRLRKA